jgi:hypothetical protein
MPGVRGVLVAVAPFPASIGAGHLGAAERACLLAELAECYGKLVVCHLRDPLRCRLAVRAAWRGLVCWPSWRRSRQRDTVAVSVRPAVHAALLAAGSPGARPGRVPVAGNCVAAGALAICSENSLGNGDAPAHADHAGCRLRRWQEVRRTLRLEQWPGQVSATSETAADLDEKFLMQTP